MTDAQRLLAWLKDNPGYHTVVEMSEALGYMQHNSIHRSFKVQLSGEPIHGRSRKDSRCKEYAYGKIESWDKTEPTGVDFGKNCKACGRSGFFSSRRGRSGPVVCECGVER